MRRRTASLLPNLEAVNTQLEVAAEEQGVREGEFVLALVELLLGHQVDTTFGNSHIPFLHLLIPVRYHSRILRSLLVAFGGLLGSLARYWLSGAIQQLNGTDFPLGTLGVNILGSFILGLVASLSLERGLLGQDARIFLAVGFCGGFTTMSTFSYESVALLREGSSLSALVNVSATIGACFTGVWIGEALGRIL